MPSIKSRLYYFIIRNRHLLKGKLRKESFDFSTSIPEFRELCEQTAAKYARIPGGISITGETIDGITAEWLVPEGADPDRVVLYAHGGGYVSGSCSDHRGFVSKFAKFCGMRNLVYDYRRAPEDPFPAALEDSLTVYRALLGKGVAPQNIVLAGESAGGGLVLALLLALKERGIALPAAAVAISPWTDLTCSGGSYTTKNRRSVAPLNSWLVFSTYYAGETSKDHPLVSPLFGDPAGLPPVFINAGEDDELFDDGRRFYEKAKKAGVDAFFRAGKGMIHCYPMLAPAFREATEAMNEICEFINMHIGRKQ